MSQIRVSVAWSSPETQDEIEFQLPVLANLQQALDEAVRKMPTITSYVTSAAAFGVWGKVRSPDHVLRDGDRVEIYRALKADPKDARRANAGNRRSGKM